MKTGTQSRYDDTALFGPNPRFFGPCIPHPSNCRARVEHRSSYTPQCLRVTSNNQQIHDLNTQFSTLAPETPAPSPELWLESPQSYSQPPPSYDDTLADLPPDYTTTDALATAQTPEYTLFPSLNPSLCSNVPNCLRISCNTSPSSSFYLDEKSLYADIEFGFSEDGVRSHAKKKKKGGAAKAAWDDDDDKKKEEENAGGAGGGDNGGGNPPADGGGGDAGGEGGDGGDGGDDGNNEDEWGGWDTGKKKKKKSKKAQQEEEEAERKRKEEEDEMERKKKEEEAAAAAAATAGNDLSWADQVNDANPDDDWGTFATVGGKKKKGKKGKVRNFGCLITRCNALTLL